MQEVPWLVQEEKFVVLWGNKFGHDQFGTSHFGASFVVKDCGHREGGRSGQVHQSNLAISWLTRCPDCPAADATQWIDLCSPARHTRGSALKGPVRFLVVQRHAGKCRRLQQEFYFREIRLPYRFAHSPCAADILRQSPSVPVDVPVYNRLRSLYRLQLGQSQCHGPSWTLGRQGGHIQPITGHLHAAYRPRE